MNVLTYFKTVIVLVLLSSVGSSLLLAEDAVALKVGDAAPTFFLRDLEGENFFLSRSLKEERPIVLSFFANWCIPCRTEIPNYEKMFTQDQYADVELIYIHVSEPRQPADYTGTDVMLIQRVMMDWGMTHPVLYDRYGVVAEKYNATSLPTSVVIAPDGTIKYYHKGYNEGDEKELGIILSKILGEK